MPPLVVPNAFQVVITWGTAGFLDHAPQNVFGIRDASGGPLTQGITNGIAAQWDSAWLAFAPASAWATAIGPVEMQVTDIMTATGPQFVAPLVSATTGTGDPLPGELAAVTSIRTALRGRSFRGRFYWPTMMEAQNTSLGTLNSGTAQALTDFWEDFDAKLTVFDPNLSVGVISRLLSVITDATSFSTDDHWDSQRRRGLR